MERIGDKNIMTMYWDYKICRDKKHSKHRREIWRGDESKLL